ncbi:MAG TPA: nucleotide pyrophosphohydrolase [Candidatus Salinicoccus stercoripullorum]|uniref:Nucleotide pyrophosphohydrolase n=1 Tax=Candidatus Salinicoccus stercoripullorum TaxID=2838756 RepID=A0A9D1QH89_9STAP|nr:nucleotide pyrophosphohydrolase [Candidatus Salinicoccus stercoripullorum]
MKDLMEEINQFRDERNWRQFHNSKDLALSLSLEASELLENFQWVSSEKAIAENRDNIKDELADVFIYGLMMADDLDIDMDEAISDKLRKNAVKYPVKDDNHSY